MKKSNESHEGRGLEGHKGHVFHQHHKKVHSHGTFHMKLKHHKKPIYDDQDKMRGMKDY